YVRPIPQIAIKIAKMLDDQDYDISAVANEIKKDQVISAKILRLCNSSYVNPMTEITSIDHALIYLGKKTILKLNASAGSEEFFSQFGEGYSLCKGGLYQHALGTARLCEKLARLSGMLSPDVAYTAGLLHDIGKVVLDQYIANIQPLFYRQIQEEGKDSSIVEKNIFNTDHTKTGELLAKNWNLPKTIIDAISFHHIPDIAETNKELVHLVYVANLIMNRFQAGLNLSYIDPSILEGSLCILGLNSSQIPGIVNTLTYTIQPF
ncbi:MAG: HDOD domain-containing protein, partial [Thermodesulfobacteriota bacterium]|nr:HDOD domain-containing protein [Thermodesulfobacteriota bacterium]